MSVFVAGMLLYGLTAYVSAPLSSYQTHARGRWSVERALTLSGAVYNLGLFIGALSGGWIGDHLGLQNVYRAASLFFIVSTLIIFQAGHQKALEEQHEIQSALQPNLRANPRFFGMLGVVVFTLFAIYLPQPLTPIYLTNVQGFSVQNIGQIGAVASLSNAAIMLVLGGLLRARTGLIIGQLMVGLFVLLIWRGSQAWMFYMGYFFLGGYRLYRSMASAQARSAVRASQVGLAFGLIETGSAVSVILAPLAAGVLFDRSPQSVYAVSLAAIGASLACTALLLGGRRKQVEPGELGPVK
jgi:predicted MFS family arabinose efflux permease